MSEYDKALCEEQHKSINKELADHAQRLNGHSSRLDKLENFEFKSEERIDNLCRDLQGLTTTLRWFIGLMVGAFISFFFYAVQIHLFK